MFIFMARAGQADILNILLARVGGACAVRPKLLVAVRQHNMSLEVLRHEWVNLI
jgi:hypothetical protein